MLSTPAAQPGRWASVTLADPREATLDGPIGQALARGVARLAQPPYSQDWLLADVSFKVNRIFTNYSGDVSGRFIELATVTSPRGQKLPPALGPVLAAIPSYQKADGHFGLDMDITRPVQKNSPPVPMLWGNARLLVGLVTAAREFHDPQLLAAARKLGDYYVASAAQFCSPAREKEFLATGTYGDGFACCYFPAIESLALLYRETRDARYLDQARRMAELFQRFDALPTEHSHGNLCAWRGILELYDITGERAFLERTRAKWEAAMQGGYVWPIGGVGEHWFVFFPGDEGCSESDWLRLNLELWRFTGETRYLEVAERLLHNQYAANQCPNGGYGMCHLDGNAAGPVAKHPQVEEWNFCCSFHGPLGLHFLKAYLAAGSEDGVFVNFPLAFTAPVRAAGREWQVTVQNVPARQEGPGGVRRLDIELAPKGTASARTTLWLRWPKWATDMRVTDPGGAAVTASREGGYLRLQRDFRAGSKLRVEYQSGLEAEARRFQTLRPVAGQVSRWRDVSVIAGPDVLFAASREPSGRMTLLAIVDEAGRLGFPADKDGAACTVALPTLEADQGQMVAALDAARPVLLGPWAALPQRRRAVFAYNLAVVPVQSLPAAALVRFAARARSFEAQAAAPAFGENLEKQPQVWEAGSGWQFTSAGLRVTGGDVGLLEGEGYADYRFEFDLTLPSEGQGIAGWVVRAPGTEDGLMFQLQSADSPYVAPQFKTRLNTLRPHVRRQGRWTIADPVPLPVEIRRGETHHLAVECRGARIEVFLDGQKIHTQDDAGFHQGTVGFRASGPAEQGLFRRISLRKL